MQLMNFNSGFLVLALSVLGCENQSTLEPTESDNTVQTERELKKSGHLPSPNDLKPEVLAELRSQLKSDDEQERIGAMQQLSNVRDAASLGKMVESLEHPDPVVRQQAYEAVGALAGVYLPFDSSQSPQSQRKAIDFYRKYWQDVKDPNSMYMQIMKNPELKHTKYANPNAREKL